MRRRAGLAQVGRWAGSDGEVGQLGSGGGAGQVRRICLALALAGGRFTRLGQGGGLAQLGRGGGPAWLRSGGRSSPFCSTQAGRCGKLLAQYTLCGHMTGPCKEREWEENSSIVEAPQYKLILIYAGC